MTRFCTVPDIGNLRKWFEKNFNQPCEYHDNLYANAAHSRWDCDVMLAKHMKKAVTNKTKQSKIFVYYPVIALSFLAVRCFGWLLYDYTFWDD